MAGNRGYIVARAQQLVNNNSAELTTIADGILNEILHELYTDYDWEEVVTSSTHSFAQGVATASVATDYVSLVHAKYIDTDSNPDTHYNLKYIDFKEYLMITNPLIQSDKPVVYTISPGHGLDSSENSTAKINIYPTFSGTDQITLYYRYMPTALTADGDIPIFRNHSYLIKVLENELRGYLRDQRYMPFFIDQTIKSVRKNTQDTGDLQVKQATLDKAIFRKQRGNF